MFVVQLGPDDRVSGVNRHVEQITGLPREQLLGRDWVGTFVAEGARSAARAMLEALPSTGSIGVTTYAIVESEAGERTIEWRGRRLRDAAGAAAGAILVGTDASGERATGRPHARMRGGNEKALLATEAALRASQGRFRELFEQALDGIFLLDGDGFFIDANPSGCEMLGYTRNELVGMHGGRLSPSGPSPMRLAELHAGAHFASERRLLRKDGACVTVEISAQRLADGTILGVARDISEWRRAQEAGAELARRYRMLVDSAPYCIHEVDRDGRVVAMNPAGVRMLGLSSEAEIRGQRCIDFVGQEHRSEFAERLRAALGGTGSELEFDSIRGRRLHSSFIPLRSAEGRPDLVMGITLDVTDRRAAEQELRRAKARLLEAHRLANLGAWQLDLRTEEVWWSDEQYRLNGVPKGAGPIRQDLFLSLIHPDDRVSFAAAFDQARENGSWEGDYRIVRPDGEIRHVHGIAKITSTRAGTPLVMAGTNQDITEHKLAESRLTQSLREKEMLLREIHHRVKNNLQIVSSLVHFHARKAESSDEQAVFAELGQRLVAMSLVHEKLYRTDDLSLVDAGDYLRSLVVALRASCLGAKEVDIRFAAADVSMPMEQALPLGMIACELVTNVLKHAFPGRAQGTASIGLRAEAGRVVLTVDDDGVGFPTGFDPSRDGSFGWELIRALVAQIDGELEATSDGGTHVRVRFSVPSPA